MCEMVEERVDGLSWSGSVRGEDGLMNGLVRISSPAEMKSNAFVLAAKNGHAEVVRFLIPVLGKEDKENALRVAMSEGHNDVVLEVLPEISDEEVKVAACAIAALSSLKARNELSESKSRRCMECLKSVSRTVPAERLLYVLESALPGVSLYGTPEAV